MLEVKSRFTGWGFRPTLLAMPVDAFVARILNWTTTYSYSVGRQTSTIGNSAAEYRLDSHPLAEHKDDREMKHAVWPQIGAIRSSTDRVPRASKLGPAASTCPWHISAWRHCFPRGVGLTQPFLD